MDAAPASPSKPEPLHHPHNHYWKTTKKGRIIENWVLTKDSEGKTVRNVDLVNPKTGKRKRKKVRRYDRLPALVRIASGGARMERGDVEEDEEGEGEGKKRKKQCVVM
ncbi:hypothetical protein VE01_08578 [Pseudogymnoascus verrucosus]|uniref:Uncharacterized protein n=1 Tax=Pseudogymnoascus verrucosus TaxID=342668 RepID=A0A1B8GB14_9PEZI|nr:uncharacterized protein VE01_08578 [Pseudogymnoascus verrucosus]OBT93035.1 hypothetical protein VE01_08578 [Pseudogymnoascus verrucosus]